MQSQHLSLPSQWQWYKVQLLICAQGPPYFAQPASSASALFPKDGPGRVSGEGLVPQPFRRPDAQEHTVLPGSLQTLFPLHVPPSLLLGPLKLRPCAVFFCSLGWMSLFCPLCKKREGGLPRAHARSHSCPIPHPAEDTIKSQRGHSTFMLKSSWALPGQA